MRILCPIPSFDAFFTRSPDCANLSNEQTAALQMAGCACTITQLLPSSHNIGRYWVFHDQNQMWLAINILCSMYDFKVEENEKA